MLNFKEWLYEMAYERFDAISKLDDQLEHMTLHIIMVTGSKNHSAINHWVGEAKGLLPKLTRLMKLKKGKRLKEKDIDRAIDDVIGEYHDYLTYVEEAKIKYDVDIVVPGRPHHTQVKGILNEILKDILNKQTKSIHHYM